MPLVHVDNHLGKRGFTDAEAKAWETAARAGFAATRGIYTTWLRKAEHAGLAGGIVMATVPDPPGKQMAPGRSSFLAANTPDELAKNLAAYVTKYEAELARRG